MAVSGFFNQEQQALLKPVWDSKVRTGLNEKYNLYKRITKDTDQENFVGSKYVLTIETGRHTGMGGRPEMGNMPEGGLAKFIQSVIDVRLFYGTMKISKPSVQRALRSEGALKELIKANTENFARALKIRWGRMIWGAAVQEETTKVNYNGVSAIVNGDHTAQTTINVKGYNGWFKGDAATFITRGNDALEVGDKIVMGTAAEIAAGTADVRTVTGKNQAGTTITVNVAVSLADNDLIVRGDGSSLADCEYNAIPSGLGWLQFADDTTGTEDKFQGQKIHQAGYDLLYMPNYKSMNTAAPGTLAAWDSGRVRALILEHVEDVGLAEMSDLTLVSHWSVQEEYLKELQDQFRYEKADMSAGTKPKQIKTFSCGENIEWITDRFCPRDKLVALSLPSLVMPKMSPGQFVKWDGGSMWRDLTNQDVQVARWQEHCNLGVRTLGANLLINDIQTA